MSELNKENKEITNTHNITYRYKYSTEESIFFQLVLIFFSFKPKMTEGQLQYLTYLFLYPEEYKKKLIEDGKFLSFGAVKNVQTYLTTLGFIVRVGLSENSKTKKSFIYDLHPKIKKSLSTKDINASILISIK